MSTILIVEDNPTTAEIMVRILQTEGYDVQHCERGMDGARVARTTKPDIILMDFDLPDINGRNLILVLSKQLPESVIIAVTAHASQMDERIARRFGCHDFLAKPFEPQQLADIVKKHIVTTR